MFKPLDSLPFASTATLYHATAAAGPFTAVATITHGQSSFIHAGINTSGQDHYYYLQYVDSCGNVAAPSITHKTMNLTAQGGRVVTRLRWTPYQGWPVQKYSIFRIENGLDVLVDTTQGSDTDYVVRPAPCNVVVYYIIRAQGPGNLFSYSDTAKLDIIDTVPTTAVHLFNASVLAPDRALVSFVATDTFDIFAYSVRRSVNGGPFVALNTLLFAGPNVTFTYIDTVPTTTDRICYNVVTLDSCLNETPSDTFCLIQLKARGGQLRNTLTWQPFVGWPVQRYRIEKLFGATWVQLDSVPGTTTTWTHTPLACNQTSTYRITAVELGASNLLSLSDTAQATLLTPPPRPRPCCMP